MQDAYGRNITYLRLSVTELCNLRCRYCMPESGVVKRHHEDMLTEEEMLRAVRIASSLGIRKLRITGGEPLVKKNILSICEKSANIPGIEEVCLTTNGILLPQFATSLRKAGVKRVNISLDTLSPKKFSYITRIGKLEDVLSGIESALNAGFERVKINTVLIGGFNDDEIESLAALTLKWPIDVRFIELMPMCHSSGLKDNAYLSVSTVPNRLPELVTAEQNQGVARLYMLPNALGNVGLISPLSASFCSECNRIRLTADGKLKPCLHSSEEYPIKGLNGEEMLRQFERAIHAKPASHGHLSSESFSDAGRSMNEIGG